MAAHTADAPEKMESITVEVEAKTDDMMFIKFANSDKEYRGVLLWCNASLISPGVNLDRIRSAPFWPPLAAVATTVNHKTIPCSSERYSYKLEGQPSNLNVFQPDVIKRSNRNQPAPQLSRILRPRRFVCRKCKKAYHVEENGAELSSSSLALQTDSISVSAMVAPNGVETNAGSDGQISYKSSRRPFASFDDIASIRQVTPSIIPKLTEDYNFSGRESETESNSDDAVTVKRKKLSSEDVEEPSTATLASASVKPPQSQKKKKRAKQSINIIPMDAISADVVLKPEPDPILPSSCQDPMTEKDRPNSVAQSKKTTVTAPKNRIKAQYVSVPTPFRFPPSRSSKPNLFSITQLTTSTRENSGSSRKNKLSEVNKRSKLKKVTTRISISNSQSSLLDDTKQSEEMIVQSQTARSRLRSHNPGNEPCDVDTKSLSECTASTETSCMQEQSRHPKSTSSATSNLSPKSKQCDIVQNMKETELACVATASSSVPCPKSKSVDFEKPKNRWIREARARRSLEERNALSPTTQLDVKHAVSSELLIADSPNSKPKVRPQDTGFDSHVPFDNAECQNKSQSKKRTKSQANISTNNECVQLNSEKNAGKSVSSDESTSSSLPVLRIKINRPSQLSEDETAAKYELVGATESPLSTSISDCVPPASSFSGISCTNENHGSSCRLSDGVPEISDPGRSVNQCQLPSGVIFRVGDIVWSKLSGWPSWPAQITSIHLLNSCTDNPDVDPSQTASANKRQMYTACLLWFAWNQVSYMPCDKLYHFLQHYKRFDNKKKRGIFRQAVKEALQKSNEIQSVQPAPASSLVSENEPHLTSQQSIQPVIDSVKDSCLTVYNFTTDDVPPTHVSSASVCTPSTEAVKVSGAQTHRTRGKRTKSNVNRPKNQSQSLESTSALTSEPISGHPIQSTKIRRGVGKRTSRGSRPRAFSVLSTTSKISENPSGAPLKLVLSRKKSKSLVCDTATASDNQDGRKLFDPTVKSEFDQTSSVHTQNPTTTAAFSDGALACFGNVQSDPLCDPSNELLSQFPHVFPDLRASGILSDTVDIPTFSEDESEEEDAGRLIIDPDVMASVNSVCDPSARDRAIPMQSVHLDRFSQAYLHSSHAMNDARTNNADSYISNVYPISSSNATVSHASLHHNPSTSQLRYQHPCTPHFPPRDERVANAPVHLPYFHSSHSTVPVTTSDTSATYFASHYHSL